MITRRFIKSSIIYTLAGTLPTANAILLLPFYLLYLPAQQYGALALCLSFSVLVQLVVTYSFDASLYLHFHDYKNDTAKLSSFVSSSFTFMLVLGLAVTVILLAFGGMIFHFFDVDQNFRFYPFGVYAVLTGVFQSIFKVNNTFLQSREKPELYLWANLLSFVLVAFFTIAGLILWPGSLQGPVGGRLIAFVISAGWVLFGIYRQYGFHFNMPLLRTTFGYNTYQSIYQIQLWVINYFDRFLMVTLITLTDLGIYDFAIKCVMVLDLVIAGLVNSFFPKILSSISGKPLEGSSVEINRYYHALTALIMLMVSGTILILPMILPPLIALFAKRPGYEAAVDIVPYATLIFLFRGMRNYFGLPYNTMKYSKPLPIIFAIVAIGKTVLSWWLIRKLGIYGAIGATIIGGGLEIFLLWIWMKDRFVFFFNPLKLIFGPLVLLTAVLVGEPLLHSTGWIIHAGYVLLTGLMLTWFYRREITELNFKKLS